MGHGVVESRSYATEVGLNTVVPGRDGQTVGKCTTGRRQQNCVGKERERGQQVRARVTGAGAGSRLRARTAGAIASVGSRGRRGRARWGSWGSSGRWRAEPREDGALVGRTQALACSWEKRKPAQGERSSR